ncbi:MAG: polyprenyl synthetase family protein [Bdellovibrionota bacterium]|jgi:geranylgeranyl diphosphate synthase type II
MFNNNFYLEKIEEELKSVLDAQAIEEPMKGAVYYSIFPAGKRIRPLMVLALMEDLKKDPNIALRASIAIEFLHCASLIHDDLPAFDDDDFRRGSPSCHKAYGEASAILAGDFLPMFALKTIAKSSYSDDIKVKLSAVLSNAFLELCNGQQLDILENEQKKASLLKIYELKTGGLFKAILGFASIIGEKNEDFTQIALKLGAKIGVYFQIIDDYIDIFGTKESRGKPQSSDEKNEKFTIFNVASKEKGLEALKNSENKIYSLIEKLRSLDNLLTFDNLKYFIGIMKNRM